MIPGPSLPTPLTSSAMVSLDQGVLVVGGSTGGKVVDTCYRLASPRGPWIQTKQSLKLARSSHVALLVPDEALDCHD